jgi:hypothetical protein
MFFRELMPNCTFGHQGQLCVKLPRPTAFTVGNGGTLLANALMCNEDGAHLVSVADTVVIQPDNFARHPDVELALRIAPATGGRRYLPVPMTPMEGNHRVNAVLIGAPITFILI